MREGKKNNKKTRWQCVESALEPPFFGLTARMLPFKNKLIIVAMISKRATKLDLYYYFIFIFCQDNMELVRREMPWFLAVYQHFGRSWSAGVLRADSLRYIYM